MFTAAFIFHSRQKVTIAVSANRWMDKQDVLYLYTYNGILLNDEKQWTSDTCHNVNKPWKYYAKGNKPDTKGLLSSES